jgi:hypothetical protein
MHTYLINTVIQYLRRYLRWRIGQRNCTIDDLEKPTSGADSHNTINDCWIGRLPHH